MAASREHTRVLRAQACRRKEERQPTGRRPKTDSLFYSTWPQEPPLPSALILLRTLFPAYSEPPSGPHQLLQLGTRSSFMLLGNASFVNHSDARWLERWYRRDGGGGKLWDV